MALFNLLFDCCLILLLVRAVVANEGHMAFNRPYQFVVKLVQPVWSALKVRPRDVAVMSGLGMILLIGLRGLFWLLGRGELDFKVAVIPISNRGYGQCQVLSLLAALTFLLQVYAFITLAIVIGGLEHRTDHYSRLLRALLGPFKKMSPWLCCALPMLGLMALWSVALWMLQRMGLLPADRPRMGRCLLTAIPLTLALVVDLAQVWVVFLFARIPFSLLPIWRPAFVAWLERVTDPLLAPFRRFNLKFKKLDFTPAVSAIVLAVLHVVLLLLLERIYLGL
jgi:uncharacterized protein YggT (Ycf19 family)